MVISVDRKFSNFLASIAKLSPLFALFSYNLMHSVLKQFQDFDLNKLIGMLVDF